MIQEHSFASGGLKGKEGLFPSEEGPAGWSGLARLDFIAVPHLIVVLHCRSLGWCCRIIAAVDIQLQL